MTAAADEALPDFESIVADAPCGLLLTADDGTIVSANRTFCRWIDRPADELVGRTFQSLLSIGGQIFHQTHWAPLLHIQGSVAEVKLDVVAAGGKRIPMVLNARRCRHGDAFQHQIALFVAEDRHRYERELLLARKRADELLSEVERQRSLAEDRATFAEQMVGIVSHDLRNPLSVIRLSAAILARGELSTTQRTAAERIARAVDRAQRLIADLLDFTAARIGSGLPVLLRPLVLHELVADTLADLRLSHPDREIVHRSEGDLDARCVADPDRLQQLVVNLVANAVTYGAAGRPVTVRSSLGRKTVSLSVHNEGPPIDDALRPRLFEPLIRGEQARTSHSVGLGLFIVREIARAHGGDVAVESSAEGGTRFVASWPCDGGDEAGDAAAAPEAT